MSRNKEHSIILLAPNVFRSSSLATPGHRCPCLDLAHVPGVSGSSEGREGPGPTPWRRMRSLGLNEMRSRILCRGARKLDHPHWCHSGDARCRMATNTASHSTAATSLSPPPPYFATRRHSLLRRYAFLMGEPPGIRLERRTCFFCSVHVPSPPMHVSAPRIWGRGYYALATLSPE